MKYRCLPRTELTISEIGFGMWTLGTDWWGHVEEQDKLRLLDRAFDLGMNFFDTADTYGKGYGEEILARGLGSKRHEIVISTKFGYDFYNGVSRTGHQERVQKFEPDFIKFACDESLRRLKSDYIDIYQLHNPRLSAIESDEVFNALEELVQAGKIRYFGVALGPDIGWFEEGESAMKHREIRSMQVIYSILEQEPARRFFPIASEENVGLISRVPHASEVLTGRFTEPPAFDEKDHRSHRKHEWLIAAIKKAETVGFLAEETGRTLAQASIKFCLHQNAICSVLPNLTNINELEEYTSAIYTADMVEEEILKLDELWNNNFYLNTDVVV